MATALLSTSQIRERGVEGGYGAIYAVQQVVWLAVLPDSEIVPM